MSKEEQIAIAIKKLEGLTTIAKFQTKVLQSIASGEADPEVLATEALSVVDMHLTSLVGGK